MVNGTDKEAEPIDVARDHLDLMRKQLDALEKHRVDIERALVYGASTYSFGHVCQRVFSGDLDVYVLDNSILLCEVLRYPNRKVYNVYIAAGDLEEVLAFEPQMCAEATARKCAVLMYTGRKGWSRALTQLGWESSLVTMTKEL